MKNKITLLLALLTITALPGWGQAYNPMYQGRVSVVQNDYYVQGDSVYVDMTIHLNDVKIDKRSFVLLTPEISNPEMKAAMDLPSVTINGKNRYKAYKRLVALHREPVGVAQAIDAHKNPGRSFRYAAVAPYEPWMLEGNFRLREDQCRCNGPIVPMAFELIAGGMENRNTPTPDPVKVIELHYAVSYKEPNPEPVKNRSESGKAFLDFAVGRSELRPEFKNNGAELAKIGSLVRLINDDPYTTVSQIIIDGYASPEGSYTSNMTLSNNRAIALKNYVRSTYGLKESLFRVNGRGEDWTGLEELVANSDKPYKDAALAIIRGTDIFDGREKKLMDMQGGAPYKEMLAEMFPQLRRSDYEVKYTVIPFTVEQGRVTIKTTPSLMSLNEMFLVAQSYPKESPEYNEVFAIAAKVYPQNDIANLNAAANALAAGNTDVARAYLDKVTERDAAWLNDMGVLAAMRDDYATAAGHFTAAATAGNAEASKNLAELDKLKEVQ